MDENTYNDNIPYECNKQTSYLKNQLSNITERLLNRSWRFFAYQSDFISVQQQQGFTNIFVIHKLKKAIIN